MCHAAELGHDVIGIDVDGEKISRLQEGKAPFFEPGLQPLLDTMPSKGRLAFSTDSVSTVDDRDIVFICVGTPPRASGADVVAVADVMGSDPRIGRSFLNAGLGYDPEANPLVVDGRNMFHSDEMRSFGFTYLPTGRPSVP
jgi:UDP-glucose 6-dehydrogenase